MALFQVPEYAEHAVAELSLNGFTEKDVAMVLFSAVPPPRSDRGGVLAWLSRGGALGDTIDRSDGVSVMDGASVGAVLVGLVGLVWGTRMSYGPITVGTLGMLGGGLIGYLIDRLIPEKRKDIYEASRIEGLIMVQVTSHLAERADAARKALERHNVKQIAVLHDDTTATSGGADSRST